MLLLFLCFFFFQAEDGIRDDLVTGVQTCALPISLVPALSLEHDRRCAAPRVAADGTLRQLRSFDAGARHTEPVREVRSEERRVGKECRCRGWPYHQKKKVLTNNTRVQTRKTHHQE